MAISASDMAGLSGMFDSAGALQAKDIANKYKLGTATLKNNYKIAQLESKDRRKAIEAETLMNRERIAQARAEMEQIGIPQMLINKFVAEKTAEIAQQDMDLKKEVAAQDYGLKVGEMTGTFNGAPTQAAKEFAAKMGIDEGTLTGLYNGMPTLAKQQFEEQARQFGLTFGQDKLEQDRRFGLDTAQFKAQLASTPDTYFQSKQFNANDLPRLMGQMQPGSQDLGSPTPGIARMGEMLQYGQGSDQVRQAYGSISDPGLDPNAAANRGQRLAVGDPSFDPNAAANRDPTVRITDPGFDPLAAAGRGQERGISDPGFDPNAAAGRYGGSDVNLTGAPQRGISDPGFDPNAAANRGQTRGITDPGFDPNAADDRQKQIAQVAKASPPSPYDGLDDQDTASLKLMESIYKKGFQGLPRGEIERLSATGRLGFLKSAGNLLGFSPDQEIAKYNAYAPSQGDARLA